MAFTIGDYIFTVSDMNTILGDTIIRVTDYLGTDCGTFYGDVTDTEDDIRAMAEAFIAEMESPEGT
jgi:hypothetical protein